ncbi:MAG: sulfotransferase family protein [Acidimicrobiia bacterium]|nr:sulfotransferase family protein [Acidimicrobiia bacterium]
MTIRICMWSGPRTISTALMYSFAQRSDTTVVDEPLYAHYLRVTPASSYHPGADEVMASMETDGRRVVSDVILGDYPTPVVFFKQMTHHLVALDTSFLDQTVNVILTRDPHDMLRSYAAVVDAPSVNDTGYPQNAALYDDLVSRGQDPIVIDSTRTLRDPESVLVQLCERIGIPFDPAMLGWEAGPRPEDGVWARHWYGSVHRSTGFGPPRSHRGPMPSHLVPLLEECLPHYRKLADVALAPATTDR